MLGTLFKGNARGAEYVKELVENHSISYFGKSKILSSDQYL